MSQTEEAASPLFPQELGKVCVRGGGGMGAQTNGRRGASRGRGVLLYKIGRMISSSSNKRTGSGFGETYCHPQLVLARILVQRVL